MITIRPFKMARESVLPLWSQAAQARHPAPNARAPELFVLLHGMLSNLNFHPPSPIPAAFLWTWPGVQSWPQHLSSTSSALRPKPVLQTNILTRPHLVVPLRRSHASPSTQHEKKPSSRSTRPPLRWTVAAIHLRVFLMVATTLNFL